ncbi:MAG: polysaccharide biosynthesis protein [Anaerolineae bacterium]|nr:polysaccharide biosynthesis protein [Anaerolineae bacterium]
MTSILSKRHQQTLVWVCIDLLVVFIAYSTAFAARAVSTPLDYIQSMGYIVICALLMVIVLWVFGVYKRIWSHTSGHGVTVIVNAVAVSTAVIVVPSLIIVPRPLPLSIILLGNLLSLLGFTAVRYQSRLISGLSWRWKAIWKHEFPQARTRVLIIGAGEAGQTLTWRLKHRSPDKNYEVVGFIDDDPEKQKMLVEGSPVLGTLDDIVPIAHEYKVDLIVVAVHTIKGQAFRNLLAACESTNAMIKVLPDVFAMVNARAHTPPLRDVRAEDLIGRAALTRCDAVSLAPVMGKVICITGASGSIGSELARQMMLYQPDKVILLDNNESGLHDLYTQLSTAYPDIELVVVLADITRQSSIEVVFDTYRPQIVFHAAAYKHVPMLENHPHEALRVNIDGTWCVAQLAQQYGTERFILVSTDKAVNPISVMGASKRICEFLLHTLTCKTGNTTLFAAVRFGNVLGSRGSVVPTFNQQIDSGGPVTVTHPEMTRYFMSIPEAANLIIHAACMTIGDDIFMLKMGEVVRIAELAERMIRMHGLRPYQDIQIKFTGIRPGEKMHEELFNDEELSMPTVHPHIIRIHSQSTGFDTMDFLDKLGEMIAGQTSSSAEILPILLNTIRVAQSQPISGD